MTSLEDQQALLLYRVGPVLCCAPSLHVLSIIQPVPLTHPPGTDAARPGIFRHSGHVIKTEELRVRFGVDEAERRPGRMIITEVDSGRTAFWVDDIIDVISMPAKGWGQLPPHLPKGIFSRTLLLDDKIYLYAEFDALQKLQGHGLLKTYIEQLLQEKRKSEAPTKPQPTSVTTRTTSPAETKQQAAPAPSSAKAAAVNVVVSGNTANPTSTTAKPVANDLRKTAQTQTTTVEQTSITTKPVPPAAGAIATHHKTITTPAKHAVSRQRAPVQKTKSVDRPSVQATARLDIASKQARQPATTPVTTTHTKSITPTAPEKKRGFPWLALLVVLLLFTGSGGGIYYYLLDTTAKKSTKHDKVASSPAYTTRTPTPADRVIAPTTTVESPDVIQSAPVTTATATPETNAPAADNIVDPLPDYQAKIEKDEQGITIVIKAPKEEAALKHDAVDDMPDNTTPPDKTSPPPNESPVPTKVATATANTEEKTMPAVPKPRREEILHIVVKGDTLWHIAERYVNNPFRYPELARLSNIKNPDLIYPGNRVRIIREYN